MSVYPRSMSALDMTPRIEQVSPNATKMNEGIKLESLSLTNHRGHGMWSPTSYVLVF